MKKYHCPLSSMLLFCCILFLLCSLFRAIDCLVLIRFDVMWALTFFGFLVLQKKRLCRSLRRKEQHLHLASPILKSTSSAHPLKSRGVQGYCSPGLVVNSMKMFSYKNEFIVSYAFQISNKNDTWRCMY